MFHRHRRQATHSRTITNIERLEPRQLGRTLAGAQAQPANRVPSVPAPTENQIGSQLGNGRKLCGPLILRASAQSGGSSTRSRRALQAMSQRQFSSPLAFTTKRPPTCTSTGSLRTVLAAKHSKHRSSQLCSRRAGPTVAEVRPQLPAKREREGDRQTQQLRPATELLSPQTAAQLVR